MSTSNVSVVANPQMTPRAWLWAALIAGGILLGVAFHGALIELYGMWMTYEEYSHGVIVPMISLYLLWQLRDRLTAMTFRGSWFGSGVVAIGLCVGLLGNFAAAGTLTNYGFLISLWGLFLAAVGWRSVGEIWAPLAALFFMIPLPNFLYNNLSLQLQLVSSEIGVWFIRAFGISVYLEGNVIDLGAYHLQVAEACNGLRYLFPLMTLAFLMALFFRVSLWKRVVLFLSSIPITILLNSFRVGTIGLMVEHWGTGAAEGFVHDFQGWVVFMISAALMVLEMIALARIGERRPWREVFTVDPSLRRVAPASPSQRAVPERRGPMIGAVALLCVAAIGALSAQPIAEIVPPRTELAEFPNRIAGWAGQKSRIEDVYLDVLSADDYLMADYGRAGAAPINFHISWFNSQRNAQSAIHSPRTCLPGGGWQIVEHVETTLPQIDSGAGNPLRVNRVLIQLGNQRQLVYYWFQQRGRVITNEYVVKWYIFLDSLRRHRTDGAMVRLITPVPADESMAEADARLTEFAARVAPQLDQYIPN